MKFSPAEASKEISSKYKRYLRTIFQISDPVYKAQFGSELEKAGTFSKGPYLDVTDSFVKGKSIHELVEDGELSKKFERLSGMHLDRPLYSHQIKAIDKASHGRSIVVSTGTGSGKTESFLIPIFNYIMTLKAKDKRSAGIKAMLIYPMNALANDQIKRLRELLSDCPDITYGCYTGQTQEKYDDALADYKALNDGAKPVSNELISRDQMRKAPPDIFITNYAMLEYLMLRPGDNVFFTYESTRLWRYIVLDEAHVYAGSTGIEVSMLLRRLKAALSKEDIQFILTSATLGGENENEAVAKFAENLCDSVFAADDVIRAERVSPCPTGKIYKLPPSFYISIAKAINDEMADEYVIKAIKKELDSLDIKYNDGGSSLSELLYEIVLHDIIYTDMRAALKDAPKPIDEIAGLLAIGEAEAEAFVTVASKCEKNGDRLFDARYHMFIRAAEGVFITLKPSMRLFLNRREKFIEADENEYHVFEIAVCSSCGAIYLVGKVEENILKQSSGIITYEKTVFLLDDKYTDTDDDHSMTDEAMEADEYEICARCGKVVHRGVDDRHRCEHGKQSYVNVIRIKTNNESGKITKCLKCEATSSNGILRYFFTGQEAVTSVLATSLYQELPEYREIKALPPEEEDDSGFGDIEQAAVITETIAKQFIAFSDNRQGAAFFATYFDLTYTRILYKRLLMETLHTSGGGNVELLVQNLEAMFDKYKIVKGLTNTTPAKEAWKNLLSELIDNNGSTSLSSLGLIKISSRIDGLPGNSIYKLSADEMKEIYSVFIEGMLTDAAVSYREPMNDEQKSFFTHNGIQYSYTLSDSDPKKYLKAFIPKNIGRSNKRLDYLERILIARNSNATRTESTKLLSDIWTHVFINGRYGIAVVNKGEGSYRLDADKLAITLPKRVFICDKCTKLTCHNVSDVCPTYKCTGKLIPIDPESCFGDSHYYRIYNDMTITPIKIVEHTAQLDKSCAYEYQKQFIEKKLNVLSCSTTFELGVDVGTLETVFMRNMPPSPANYAQRAGRAGRSIKSCAYALTFCNRSNHDFTYFSTPELMIRGKIDPPKFNVCNEKIAVRHLYASALSYFWREYSDFFKDAEKMNEGCPSGYDLFEDYLRQRPNNLKDYAERFLPRELSEKFDTESFGWVAGLFSDDDDSSKGYTLGVMRKALEEYKYETSVLEEARKQRFDEKKSTDYIVNRLNTYKRENILTFLSRKNVLPKYGFPVDTVEMIVNDSKSNKNLGLQLQRDLAMAISEYAPGSQIVANGNLITGRYIRKIPNLGWKMYDFIECKECKTLNTDTHTDDSEHSRLPNCRQCGNLLRAESRRTFIIPLFGFEADSNKIEKPGLVKPEKSYRTAVSYVGDRHNIETSRHCIGDTQYEIVTSYGDEMAILNESSFYVCETCGYAEQSGSHSAIGHTERSHKNASGRPCNNKYLKKYSIGYRFATDVVIIRFLTPGLSADDYDYALSVLYGILFGASKVLDIAQNDISGCLQYFRNEITGDGNYALVLYDQTPGGAGHVRRIKEDGVLEKILRETLASMQGCSCGGDDGDSSCYFCLRNYYNQKFHDQLKRKYVIDFISEMIV